MLRPGNTDINGLVLILRRRYVNIINRFETGIWTVRTDIDLVRGVVRQTEHDQSEHGEENARENEHEREKRDSATKCEGVDELHEGFRTTLEIVETPVYVDHLK